jgi:hypothetical protein
MIFGMWVHDHKVVCRVLHGTLTSRSNNCFLNSMIQLIMCKATLRGDISFRYLKQSFLVVMTRTRKYYLKNNYLTLRSKSHEGDYGM